jgi:hypothetical protein
MDFRNVTGEHWLSKLAGVLRDLCGVKLLTAKDAKKWRKGR